MLERVPHSDAKWFRLWKWLKRRGLSYIPIQIDNEDLANYILLFYNRYKRLAFKGLRHCFSTCIEITGNNWYC